MSEQVGPRLGGLAEPVGQCDELLGSVSTDAQDHQQAHLVLLKADLEVDPVDPAVHVVGVLQGALVERLGLVLPLGSEPGDRRGRQPRSGAEELLQRRHEVARGHPVQVEQREHLGDLRRLPRPRRQNRRREPPTLTGLLVDALVVDPRRPHRHCSRGRGDLPCLPVAVTDHQPVAGLVDGVGMDVDVGGDLGLQRRGEHRSRAVADKLVQQRRAHRGRGVLGGRDLLVDYLEHRRTFPNRRASAGPDQRTMDSRSSSGRCAPSRHRAEGHPQVLIIAPAVAACGYALDTLGNRW